ncbi:MAG: type I restriction enzyme HsdR N-terminal domain-containing protein [Desulfobacteraceae bacterium]|nr:type I restriction enzyme HsdR N-terminal domain-containing protein [Desulfobacteraceae bacterium]
MSFSEKIQSLASQLIKQVEHIQTEEATKSALVMPFINALGYNVFDPTEVVPEYTADVGVKKGEKVDYAVLKDGMPIMLFECKWCGSNLDDVHASQLYRYFSVTDARIGVLTNGINYRFYSDLDAANKMDSKPFLELSLASLNEPLIAELEKLTKPSFDLEEVISTASDLKYTKEIKKILADEYASPSDDFVRLLASQVYSGKLTQSVRKQFAETVKTAFNQFITDKINDRLKYAMEKETASAGTAQEESQPAEEKPSEDKKTPVTTAEEMEGFHIVKAILRETVDPSRIAPRDTLSYFGILLDDNNRQPICRLYFNRETRKYLALIDENKNEEKVLIEDLNDIYQYCDRLKETVKIYDPSLK